MTVVASSADVSMNKMNKSYIDFKLSEKRKNESYTQYYIEYLEKWTPLRNILEYIFLALLIMLLLKNIYRYRKTKKMNFKLCVLFVGFLGTYIFIKNKFKSFTR